MELKQNAQLAGIRVPKNAADVIFGRFACHRNENSSDASVCPRNAFERSFHPLKKQTSVPEL
jgi:hypothetical protein